MPRRDTVKFYMPRLSDDTMLFLMCCALKARESWSPPLGAWMHDVLQAEDDRRYHTTGRARETQFLRMDLSEWSDAEVAKAANVIHAIACSTPPRPLVREFADAILRRIIIEQRRRAGGHSPRPTHAARG